MVRLILISLVAVACAGPSLSRREEEWAFRQKQEAARWEIRQKKAAAVCQDCSCTDPVPQKTKERK